MCGRVRLSSDVSEIKLVFSIPPHRPTPNFAPSCHLAGVRGAYRLTASVAILDVPASVQAVLASRIDRLGEREKQVLPQSAGLKLHGVKGLRVLPLEHGARVRKHVHAAQGDDDARLAARETRQARVRERMNVSGHNRAINPSRRRRAET
jgi:hypothetical protein